MAVSGVRPPPHASGVGALVRTVRPVNAVLMAVGVAVGGVLAGGAAALSGATAVPLALAAASATAIGAGANAHNDLHDLEIDRVNRPDRPLPSGALSVRAARSAWVALSALGAGLAALVSPLHLGIAAVSVALLAAYNADLKRRPLVGNLAVTAVIALALPFGGLAVGAVTGPVLLGAAFAAGSTLAREIAKDIEDAVGDAAGGAQTLPLWAGVGVASALAAAVTLATLAAIPLGYAAGLAPAFLVLALPTAAFLLAAAWAVLGARGEETAAHAGRASALLKGAMVAGLAALAMAAW